MGENREDPEIKIKDKRRFDEDGNVKEGADAKAEPQKEDPGKETKSSSAGEHHLPPMNFATFVLTMASSAEVALGLVPNPMTKETNVSLPHAKHTIDILEMLQEKTKGNLEAHETDLLQQVLFELRMQYVEKNK